jgi:hypothetical protein
LKKDEISYAEIKKISTSFIIVYMMTRIDPKLRPPFPDPPPPPLRKKFELEK